MEKLKERRFTKEFKIMLDAQQATLLLEFAKDRDMKIVNIVRRSLRKFFEAEGFPNPRSN